MGKLVAARQQSHGREVTLEGGIWHTGALGSKLGNVALSRLLLGCKEQTGLGAHRCLRGYALHALRQAVARRSEQYAAQCLSLLQVVSVDTQGQKAHFQDGAFQRYDQLLIATGSR